MEDQGGTRIGEGRTAVLYARAPHPSEHYRVPVEEQLDACRALAAELGYAVPEEAVLQDTGSGTTLSRPGITALMRIVTGGRADAVIVHALDRLARLDSRPLEALLRELRRRSVPVYVANPPQGYRYAPATGKLVHDDAAVAAANREEWRPPEYIIIPPEHEPS